MRLVIFLDDILIMNQTKEGALKDGERAVNLLESLGFLINFKKSNLVPSQVLEYLGFKIDSSIMTLSLPLEKTKKIRTICQEVFSSNPVSVRKLSEVIGNLTASIQAVYPAPLHYRHLQMAKNQIFSQYQDYNAQVLLTLEAQRDLLWWIHHLNDTNGKSIVMNQPSVVIQTDASNLGWGATCKNVRIGGAWLQSEIHYHINVLELLPITHAVKAFLKQETNMVVLIQTDNKTAMTCINKMGGTVSKVCNQLALDLWEWCLKKSISMRAGKENVIAD
ncbi:uncharacterized protein LOC134237319 [Saccostrea cucullata]|uniref:uncharacterized protein LOC134237319 n=1 Tax=Saccostrea cuccullata TaxID=36930 RepID=UPI002ED4BA3B